MRNAMGVVGLAAGAIVVALIVHYGYVTSAAPKDGALTALTLAAIAVAGLLGPAVALRLWASSSRLAKIGPPLLGVLALAALLATFGNSLGAVASYAERARLAEARRSDEAALASLSAERAALHFAATTDAAVAAARTALVAADAARRSECTGGRGRHCEELAADLIAKRDAYAAIIKERATTERADKLDREAATIRARLDAAPAKPTQPRASAFDLIFKLSAADPVAQRKAAALAAVELLIVLSLFAWEWMRLRPSTTKVIHEAIRGIPVSKKAARREPAASGDLAIFVQDCMRRSGGDTVELRMLYTRFLEWCDERQLSPLPPKRFSEACVARCAEAQIDVRCEGSNVIFLDVSLAPADLSHRYRARPSGRAKIG